MEDNKESTDNVEKNDISSYDEHTLPDPVSYEPSDENPQIQGNTINVPDEIVLDENDPNLADFIYIGGRCYYRDSEQEPSEEFEVSHENPVSGILENSDVTVVNPASSPSETSLIREDVVLNKFSDCGVCKTFSDRYRGQTLQTYKDFTIKVIKEEDSDQGDVIVYKLSGSDRTGFFNLKPNHDVLIYNNDSLTFDLSALGDDKSNFSATIGSLDGNKFKIGTSRKDPALLQKGAETTSSVAIGEYQYSESDNDDDTGGDINVVTNPYESNSEYNTQKLKQYPHRVKISPDGSTMIIKNDGSVVGAGWNEDFQLAIPRDRKRNSLRKSVYYFTENLMSEIKPVKKIIGNYRSFGYLTYDNDLYVAGYNEYYQLGNGNNNDTPHPKRVEIKHSGTSIIELGGDIHTRIVDAAMGVYHGVALDINQRIWVWGRDGIHGAIMITRGHNSYTIRSGAGARPQPMDYGASRGYGYTHDAIAVMQARLAYWSSESTNNTAVVTQNNLFGHEDAKVVGVEAGYYTTYFLVDDGAVYSCGYNKEGQLGQDHTDYKHDNALPADQLHPSFGKVKNTGGRGVGSRPENKGTTNEKWLTGQGNIWVKKLITGANHVLMIDDNNILWGFGKVATSFGATDNNIDKPVKLAENVYDAFAGIDSSAYITQTGDVYVVGDNANGKLGIDRFIDAPVPEVNSESDLIPQWTKSTRLSGIVELQMGNYHSTGITSTGQVISLGENRYGAMGTRSELAPNLTGGDTFSKETDKDIPVNAGYLNYFGREIKFRNDSPTVLSSRLTTYLWYPDQDEIEAAGLSNYYQAGYYSDPYKTVNEQPTKESIKSTLNDTVLAGDKKIKRLIPTYNNLHIINDANELWSIGNNTYRQLGNVSNSDSPTPVQPIFMDSVLNDITHVAGGVYATLALDTDNRLYGWGNPGVYGFLAKNTGINSYTYRYRPSPMDYGAARGYGYTHDVPMQNVSILNDGQSRVIPDSVGKIVDIKCGRHTSYILNEDGELFSFGYNTNGELGQRAFAEWHDNAEPKDYLHKSFGQVFPFTSILDVRIVKIVAGDASHAFIITEDNKLWGWGANGTYQLGINESNDPNRVRNTKYSMPMHIADDVEDVFLGNHNSAYKKLNGEVYACGANTNGQLASFGDGRSLGLDRHDAVFGEKVETRQAQNFIPWFEASDGVLEIAFGDYHSIVKRVNRSANQIEWLSAGSNRYGQLAIGKDPAGTNNEWTDSDNADTDEDWTGSDKWQIIKTQGLQ